MRKAPYFIHSTTISLGASSHCKARNLTPHSESSELKRKTLSDLCNVSPSLSPFLIKLSERLSELAKEQTNMGFYILTKRDFILSAPERWEMLYTQKKKTKRDLDTLAALRRLDLEHATEGDIESIVGHRQLTSFACDICFTDVQEALVYEDRNAEPHCFCQDCFGNAAKLLGERSPVRSRFVGSARAHLSLVEG